MSEKKLRGISLIDTPFQNKLKRLKNNKLRRIKELINFSKIDKLLRRDYKYTKNAAGHPAYPPLLLFKIIFLQNLYCLSDYEIEECLHDRISFLDFVGLSVEDDVPDHSTICRFRCRLQELGLYEKVFNAVNLQLRDKGFLLNKGVIMDATIIESRERSNKSKKKSSSESLKTESCEVKASWVVKRKKSYFGYKLHTTVDREQGFIMSVDITGANVHDSKRFCPLLRNHINFWGVMDELYADKGYSSAKNREFLMSRGIKDYIMVKKPRNGILSSDNVLLNKFCISVRYKIERTFGTL